MVEWSNGQDIANLVDGSQDGTKKANSMGSYCSRNILLMIMGLGFVAYLILDHGTLVELQNNQYGILEAKNIGNDLDTRAFHRNLKGSHQKNSSSHNYTMTQSSAVTMATTKATTPKPSTTTTQALPPWANIKVDPDEKWVILHTYMRGGSTFLGAMFEKNPDAFYMFEPLHPIYHGMLGVPNTIHPLRIYANKNATWRNPEKEEHRYVVKALVNMFTCNFRALPMEILANTYMDFTKAYGYTSCVHTAGLPFYECLKPLQKSCSSQVEDAFENNCHLYMAKVHNDSSSFTGMDSLNDTAFAEFPVVNFTNCMNKLWRKIPSCLSRIEAPCRKSKLRVFKVIRGNNDLLKDLMAVNPNTYIIHQVRDPRGVVLSREYTGMLTFEIKLEAKMLCEQMRRDLKELRQLYELFPQRVKHIRYEDMAQDVVGSAHSIYMFLGEEMHSAVTKYLDSATHSAKKAAAFNTERKNSTETAFAWRSKIPKDLKEAMDKECADVYKVLQYDL